MLLLHLAFCVCVLSARTIFVSPSNFSDVLKGISSLGALAGGDTVIFPGSAASPTVYSTGSPLAVVFAGGSAASKIVVRAAEAGGARIEQSSTGNNIMEIVRGQFFELRGLSMSGGSLGLRLGTGPLGSDAVTDALFEDLEIFNTQGSLLTANSPGDSVKTHSNLVFRRLKLHHPLNPSGTNEGMYLGSNLKSGAIDVIVTNSLVEYCNVYSTLPAAMGFGGAIQIKPGSHSNIVRYCSFSNVLVGVFLYDNFDGGLNEVYGNFVQSASDNCIQVTAGAVIHDNIMFDCGNNGIQVANNQLKTGTSPRNVQILYNTVVRAADSCLRAVVSGTSGITVTNNVFFCEATTALRIPSAGNTVGVNALLGTNINSNAGQLELTGTTSTYINNSGNAGDTASAWPKVVSPGLVGSASFSAAPSQGPNSDFNCVARTSPTDIGAYQSKGASSNPGWALSNSFRNPALCPPGAATTTVSSATTTAGSPSSTTNPSGTTSGSTTSGTTVSGMTTTPSIASVASVGLVVLVLALFM